MFFRSFLLFSHGEHENSHREDDESDQKRDVEIVLQKNLEDLAARHGYGVEFCQKREDHPGEPYKKEHEPEKDPSDHQKAYEKQYQKCDDADYLDFAGLEHEFQKRHRTHRYQVGLDQINQHERRGAYQEKEKPEEFSHKYHPPNDFDTSSSNF